MLTKSAIFVLILLLLASVAGASLNAPTTYSVGYKIWGKYWDMMGENGIRNGTLGGTGNNMTFFPLNIETSTGNNVLQWNGSSWVNLNLDGAKIYNNTLVNVTVLNTTVLNATNIQGNGSSLSALNASNLTSGTISANRLPQGRSVVFSSEVQKQNTTQHVFSNTQPALLRQWFINDTIYGEANLSVAACNGASALLQIEYRVSHSGSTNIIIRPDNTFTCDTPFYASQRIRVAKNDTIEFWGNTTLANSKLLATTLSYSDGIFVPRDDI